MKSHLGGRTMLGLCLLGVVSLGRPTFVVGDDGTERPQREEDGAGTHTDELPVRFAAVEDAQEASDSVLPWDPEGNTWFLGGDVSAYDVAPCGGNGQVNLDDILSILAAFGGNYACSCPGAGGNWDVNGADIYNSNAGNVGIGTNSPFFPLHVFSTGASGGAVYAESTAAIGTAYGVYGESSSTSGNGVYGIATAGTGSTYGGRFVSDSTDGRGVYGEATAGTGGTYGGYFESDSTTGRGVYGRATDATGFTYGGHFVSDGTSGRGVFGHASAATGFTYGVIGQSDSTNGRGVYGEAIAGTGVTYGVQGDSLSTSGRGVVGNATAGTGTTYGVYGLSDSTDGRGVEGEATAGTGTTYGGRFVSNSTAGYGVYGEATAATGVSYGGVFRSDSPFGRGVTGYSSSTTGTTYGVVGQSNSPDGFAGYFTGPVGSRNYFARNIGIGTTSPDATFHVADGSDASLSSGSGYVVLGDVPGSNLVIDNNEIIARNNGAGASLFINNEGGNVGILRNSASHPLHVGNDTSTGNGAHLTAGGTWTNGSDRNSKENFKPLDAGAILEKVAELPLSVWNYIGETDGVHHIGPTAQDFHAAFGLGHDERYITTIDADGVALAAIQGLHEIVRERESEIENLKTRAHEKDCELQSLRDEMAELRAMMNTLIERTGGTQ